MLTAIIGKAIVELNLARLAFFKNKCSLAAYIPAAELGSLIIEILVISCSDRLIPILKRMLLYPITAVFLRNNDSCYTNIFTTAIKTALIFFGKLTHFKKMLSFEMRRQPVRTPKNRL